jgi:hypothetical protein
MDDQVRAFLENEQQLRLIKRLGRGGFAEVWEVEAPSGVRSAVKVSLDPIDGKTPAVQKELGNLKLIRTLSGHPHLVTLIDYWLVEDYLVTRWELATGGDLLQLCEHYRRHGKPGISVKELIKLVFEAATGLDFLHQHGIYHRDIKPQNLLLFHGHVKIGDLGLAKLVGASTASHTGSGTFGYLPPEAWEEHRLSPTVDLYSLAATYIRLRTGREPFGTNPVEIVERQKKGEPILEGLTEAERSLLLVALAADPEKRFGRGCQAWVLELNKAIRKRDARVKKTTRPTPRVTAVATTEAGEELVRAEVISGDVAEAVVATVSPEPSSTAFRQLPKLKITESTKESMLFGLIISGIGGVIVGAIFWGIIGAILGMICGIIVGALVGEFIGTVAEQTDSEIRGVATDGVGRASEQSGLLDVEQQIKDVTTPVRKQPRATQPPPLPQLVTSAQIVAEIVNASTHNVVGQGWNAHKLRSLRQFVGHTAGVSSVAFSPDGLFILTGSYDRTARLWDASTGSELRRFVGHEGVITSVAFSPDKRLVATGSEDKTVIFWDTMTGTSLRQFPIQPKFNWFDAGLLVLAGVVGILGGPFQPLLAQYSLRNTMRALEEHELNRIKNDPNCVKTVAFSPDGQFLITGSWDKSAILLQTATAKRLQMFRGHDNWVTAAAFSPDGCHILTASHDKTAILWNARLGWTFRRRLRTFKGHAATISCVAFSPDGRYIVTGSWDKNGQTVGCEKGERIASIRGTHWFCFVCRL